MTDLGEILDPVRRQVIDIKDALVHARYRYDGLDLILETVADSKIRGAAQEIFTVAGEKMNAVDDMLDERYRQLSHHARTHQARARTREGRPARARYAAKRDAIMGAATKVFADQGMSGFTLAAARSSLRLE